MARNLLPLLGVLALAPCALSGPNAAAAAPFGPQAQPLMQPQAQSSQALIGIWSATLNWNLPSGLMITTSFMANGRIQSTIQNHQGMSYTLMGTYQFNAAQSTLIY